MPSQFPIPIYPEFGDMQCIRDIKICLVSGTGNVVLTVKFVDIQQMTILPVDRLDQLRHTGILTVAELVQSKNCVVAVQVHTIDQKLDEQVSASEAGSGRF